MLSLIRLGGSNYLQIKTFTTQSGLRLCVSDSWIHCLRGYTPTLPATTSSSDSVMIPVFLLHLTPPLSPSPGSGPRTHTGIRRRGGDHSSECQWACLQVCKNLTMQVLVNPLHISGTTRNERDFPFSKSIRDLPGMVRLWI